MKSVFRWKNPITSPAFPAMRDPQITVMDGVYYMTATYPPFFDGPCPGVPLYSSRNLLDWKFENWLLRRDDVPDKAWYKERFWAPEIHRKHDKFWLTFNCRNEAIGKGNCTGGLAVADKITGPYTVLTPDDTITCANDTHLFTDDDGTTYLFCGHGMYRPFDLLNCKPLGPWFPGVQDESADWCKAGIEGPFCIKRNGVYYVFLSSWTRGYEVGVATAKRIGDPWQWQSKTPLFGARDKGMCDGYAVKNDVGVRTENGPSPFCEIGHNSVFPGPDGRDWIAAHYHPRGTRIATNAYGSSWYEDSAPQLGFDPMWIDANGEVATNCGGWTEQQVELPDQT